MSNRPIRPAKSKLPPIDPIIHERARFKAERAEMQAALDQAHRDLDRLWPLAWALERAARHGNLDGDLEHAWDRFESAVKP